VTEPASEGLRADAELKARLQAVASPVHKAKGSYLFREHQAVAGVYLVRSGQIKLTLKSEHKRICLMLAGPDYVLGLPATLANRAYSLTAQVTEDADFAFVPHRKALALLRDDPQLCFRVVRMLSDEVRHLRNVIAHPLPVS